MRRLLAASLLALLAGLALAVPATSGSAQSGILEEASAALRRDPVFVHADAERKITAEEADELRQAIRSSNQPIFIALLPAAAVGEAGGNPEAVPPALAGRVRLSGTYAVVAGGAFRAGSLPAGNAAAIATAAFQARRDDGTAAVLREFVDRIAQAGATAGPPATDQPRPAGDVRVPDDTATRDEGSGAGLLWLFLLVGGGALALVWFARRQGRRRTGFGDRLDILRSELQVLAGDVLSLEPEVVTHPEARADYAAAANRYQVAEAAIGRVSSEEEAEHVERVLLEGRYAMARARARIEGREPPPPPAELTHPGRHQQPAIELDDRNEPVYAGRRGGFYDEGGWFGGGSGLLTGLLLGQVLGGGWGGGRVEEHHHHDDGGDSDAGGFDTGGGFDSGFDVGGGDFDAGDVGDMGDVGGGDW